MTKPTAQTKPGTTSTTTPADPTKPSNGNGSPAATTATEPADHHGNEAVEPVQAGKRPLTVLVSEKTYRHLRMLAASEGSSVSAVVIEAVEISISAKLKAALAALARDLG